MEQQSTKHATGDERWKLIRDVLVFQCKLLVDGLRDLVLLPVSLVAGIVSLVGKGRTPGPEFYDLLRVARRSERWINLFGAVGQQGRPDPAETAPDLPAGAQDLDALVARVESFLVEEYRKGGLTAQAKERLDRALDSLYGARNRIERNRESSRRIM